MRDSEPAVTRGLQELEDILGVELFERTSCGLIPTIFGDALTLHARDVIAQLGQAGAHLVELASGGRGCYWACPMTPDGCGWQVAPRR